jgi:hypothetical protein
MVGIRSAGIFLHELHPASASRLDNAVRKLLGMSSVRLAFAQIIDNMPVRGHYYGHDNALAYPHPDIESRDAPTKQSMEMAQDLCTSLDPMTLKVDANV